MKSTRISALVSGGLLITSALVGCSKGAASGDTSNAVTTPSNALADSAKSIAEYLTKFDTLDFEVFNNQKWDRLKESHAQDIVVTWPDGHDAKGLDKHIEDLKAMFVATPDFHVDEHPVKIANGHWTAVIGHATATFSKPMPIGNGKTIPPTGKKLSLNMVTVGHWTDAGVMDHEWLFWDGATYAQQLGLK